MQTLTPTLTINTVLGILHASLPDASKEKRMVSGWIGETERHRRATAWRYTILDAIREGYDTCDEIASAADLPESTTYKKLQRLIRLKLVKSTMSKSENNRLEKRYELVDVD